MKKNILVSKWYFLKKIRKMEKCAKSRILKKGKLKSSYFRRNMKCNQNLGNCETAPLVSFPLLTRRILARKEREVILIFRVEQRTFFFNELGYWCGSHNCSVLSLYFAIYKWFRLEALSLKIINGFEELVRIKQSIIILQLIGTVGNKKILFLTR